MHIVKSGAAGDCPVNYGDAKVHLRLIDDTELDYVNTLISVATAVAEAETNRTIRSQTLILYQDAPPETAELRVPYPPLSSVTHIKYKDVDGVTQTFSSSEYSVDTTSEPGRIALVEDSTGWPSVQSSTINAFWVEFVAGYATAAACPIEIRQAIMMIVHHLYEHRSEVQEVNFGQSLNLVATPKAVDRLLWMQKIPYFGG